MGIHGCVLDDHIFRNAYPERGEIPQSFDSTGNDLVRNLLRLVNRDSDDPDGRTVLFLILRIMVDMINRDAVDDCPVQLFTDVKTSHNLQSVLFQTGVLQEGGSQTSHAKQESLVGRGES